MFQQNLSPVGDSLALSALCATIPLITLFVLLGGLRMKAWVAGLISLAVALLVAIALFEMPVGQALLAGTEGAAFGFFPILWIVINAIWVYNLTVASGHFDVLRRSFEKVSPDQRIQAMIIAFCFGALLEALAGFGTPVAITVVMLMALGFRPIKAAAVALIANTAPVAFGALATPIVTLAAVASGASDDPRLDVDTLGAMVGRQTPILAVIVPLVLVFVVDGRRGVRQTWLAALVCGAAFGFAQFVAANYISVPLADIIAALVAAAAVVLLLRVWKPSEVLTADQVKAEEDELESAGSTHGARRQPHGVSTSVTSSTGRAANSGSPAAPPPARPPPPSPTRRPRWSRPTRRTASSSRSSRSSTSRRSRSTWPRSRSPTRSRGRASTSSTPPASRWRPRRSRFNWLPAAGTLMILAGLITMVILKVSPGDALRTYGRTYVELKSAIITVMAVLALAYVMNLSGQTASLGAWLAGTGAAFALLSPILGWLGVAVTGSDTSANALFGALQVQTAAQAGLDPVLMAAANTSGGVLGKMVSPQNLAIAAAAVGMAGREGDIFRKVIGWSLGLLLLMCILVGLQSTSVLSWMVP